MDHDAQDKNIVDVLSLLYDVAALINPVFVCHEQKHKI